MEIRLGCLASKVYRVLELKLGMQKELHFTLFWQKTTTQTILKQVYDQKLKFTTGDLLATKMLI
jgi:mannose/fructose-specific phosphotransferase system component IIA